ncbi:MAG: branched-chain amino acid ABC transporter substrate-binding protein, partial [Planctomycetota bacterium]|nr:branched-chain amino acid ABC transporter substrate-binding protein [Planctomycetota bacterium]
MVRTRGVRNLSLLAILFLGCLLLCACGDGGQKSEEVIKIGVAGPLTGGQAKMGSDILNGVTLAVDEWNAKGGVLGKKIVIVKQDDGANEQLARSVANTLVNENVVGVIGHFNSGCTIPASVLYNEAGIPMITPSATNPYVTERKLFDVFRVCGRDDIQGRVAAEYVVDVLGCKKIAALHDKTAYGEGLATYFKETVEKRLGADAMVYYGGFTKQESNFRPYLEAMSQKSPEIYFFGGIYDQAGPLAVQAKDMGINIPMV